jgi:hypothetical protein
MNEALKGRAEVQETSHPFTPEDLKKNVELESTIEESPAAQIAEARQEVIKEPASKEKLLNKMETEQMTDDEPSARSVNKKLLKNNFDKEISHIRKKMNSLDKVGSKIIHQPNIRSLSEVSSKTLTRPSGLLGGGIVAFLGTGTYLYYTKHIGLKYNYTIFLLLLVGGFIIGLLIEAFIRIIRGRR